MTNIEKTVDLYGFMVYLVIEPDTKTLKMDVNFGEVGDGDNSDCYAIETHYNKSRMENELDVCWEEIEDAVKEEGFNIADQTSSEWIDDDYLKQTYEITSIS